MKTHKSALIVWTLNPATLLPVGHGPPDHACIEVMGEVFSTRLDLTDQPLTNPDVEYYTDGSSYVQGNRQLAGYTVVTLHTTIEAKPLPQGALAQKVELIALTQALQLAAG